MGSRSYARAKPKFDAERPFWISYADLMTAMMTLCLVVMAVTIIAIGKKLDIQMSAEETRARQIRDFCLGIQSKVRAYPHISVNCVDNRINFGEAGRFGYQDYRLRPEASPLLAELVPVVLEAAAAGNGNEWFKQVVIEGYTDIKGSYLYNLYLSLQRSYWVMCTLIDPKLNANLGLTEGQVQQIRNLFLAGGVSFNDAKASDADSRRVELRLQFYTLKEKENSAVLPVRPTIQAAQQDVCELT